MLQKVVTIKRFEHPTLGKELKAQTDIAKKQYQGLYRVYQFVRKEKDQKPKVNKYHISGLMYDSIHSRYKYSNI